MAGIPGVAGVPSPDVHTVQGPAEGGIPVPTSDAAVLAALGVDPIAYGGVVRSAGYSSTFPSRVPTATQPDPTNNPGLLTNPGAAFLELTPFGVGGDGATGDVRVIGWSVTSDGLWVPTPLTQYSLVLCTATGISTKVPANTDYFADTLTLTYGNDLVDTLSISMPGTNLIARFVVDVKQATYVEPIFNAGTATGLNAVYRWLGG